jgi:hypothetical protein
MLARAFMTLLGLFLIACGATSQPTRETVGEAAPQPGESKEPDRKEGEECGGYPGPGIVGSKCAPGLVCDYAGSAVDGPGHCKLAP